MIVRRYLPLIVLAAALSGCDAATPRTASVVGLDRDPQSAEAVEPLDDDVTQALRRAEQEHKPLLLFFTAQWCSFCRQMETEVFEKSEFRSAAERYVVVQVDGARHRELCAKYRVAAYPTLVLAASDGTTLDRVVGKSDSATLVVKMNAALTTFIALRPEAATIR